MTAREEHQRHQMTLRVYRADKDGTAVEERAQVVVACGPDTPLPQSMAYPPCRCPRCRDDQLPGGPADLLGQMRQHPR
ncbi:hypothetical protein HRW23_00105 [Streptomyces lunaelactis]|uniref:hypothetical protein n=1 Tax=Streptomyces lunaelactis TaxID=1535768 RepID=UPI0015853ECA|nr:hypothetical protein [Streptomyces lunaelactis]NUK12077.1 hypothetical protein [Streptomyces lunaelactis]NUK26502.1 hypothetical protein [Streptomyces lunaelactis]NUK60972.1 hypothetical protein [Streptomyces lunaelactis]NUK73463.1 hypothetical protein [Streptomyces lunaelactis]NUK75821.1 hypothetical protein [Streptomyces lunaelactis]